MKYEEYAHKNGYVARLYGKSSLCVYFNGKKVLHTGFRNVHTEDEVMEMLEDMPKFFNSIEKMAEDVWIYKTEMEELLKVAAVLLSNEKEGKVSIEYDSIKATISKKSKNCVSVYIFDINKRKVNIIMEVVLALIFIMLGIIGLMIK